MDVYHVSPVTQDQKGFNFSKQNGKSLKLVSDREHDLNRLVRTVEK